MRTDHDPFAPPPFSDTGEQKITMDSKVKLTGEMKTPRKPKAAPKPGPNINKGASAPTLTKTVAKP